LPQKSAAGLRTVGIPPELVAHLKDYRRRQREEVLRRGLCPGDDLLFPSKHGGLQKPSTFGWRIKAAGERAGAKLFPHMLGHRFGTDMLLGTVDPRIAQTHLGHARVSTTQAVYQYVIEDAQQAASEVASNVMSKVWKDNQVFPTGVPAGKSSRKN
jgi:integrase